MSSAIEVLKKYSTSCSVCKYNGGNQCKASGGEFGECRPAEELIKAIDEALLALEQKDYLLRELNEIKKLVGDLNDFREELHIDSYEDLELIEHIESIEKVIKRAKKEIHKQRIKELEEGVSK